MLREMLSTAMACCFYLGTAALIVGLAKASVMLLLFGVCMWAACWALAQIRA